MDALNIECPKCSRSSKLRIQDEYIGKTIVIKCSNIQCRSDIKVFVPLRQEVLYQSEVSENDSKFTKSNQQIAARLIVQESINGLKQSYVLSAGSYTVGRKSSQITIEIPVNTRDRLMSRRHCIINCTLNDKTCEYSFSIKDVDSKNRVVINNIVMAPDEELILLNGDKIILGTTVLLFETNEK
jgi:pSer/pThr/pTyr-binding forkhead associated (FHA) protein